MKQRQNLHLYVYLLCHETELQLAIEKRHSLAIYLDNVMPPLYATLSYDKYHDSTVKVLPISMNCVTSNEEG